MPGLWVVMPHWSLLSLTLCRSVHLTVSVRTLSWFHLYQPSPSAMGHLVQMGFRMQRVPPNCLHGSWILDGSNSLPQIFRLFALGKSLATAHRGTETAREPVPTASTVPEQERKYIGPAFRPGLSDIKEGLC